MNKYGIAGYEYILRDYQVQSINEEPHYTSAGFDMIDDINQRIFYNDYRLPRDRVDGYTIKQLEDALIGAESWWQWRDNIKNKYPNNPTRIHLEELFANWPN